MVDLQHLLPTNLREQVLAELRTRLVTGALQPGQVYSASAIAAELEVSSGPVREAMLTLVNDGLMEIVRNRGYRVTSLSEQDRLNIAEIRSLLEIPSMVKLATTPLVRGQEAYFTSIVDELHECAEREDIVAFLAADRAFHLGLLALLNNNRLTEFIGTLRDQTRQYGIQELAARGELLHSAGEHREILNALLARDTRAVESLMHKHLRHLRWTCWRSADLKQTPTGPASRER